MKKKLKKSPTQKFVTALMTGLLVLGAWMPAMAVVPGSWTTAASRKDAVPKAATAGIIPMEQVGWKTAYLCNSASATLLLDENGDAPKKGIVHKIGLSSAAAATEQFFVYDSSAANTVGSRQLAPPLDASTSSTVYSPDLDLQFHGGVVFKMSASSTCGFVYWSPDGRRN